MTIRIKKILIESFHLRRETFSYYRNVYPPKSDENETTIENMKFALETIDFSLFAKMIWSLYINDMIVNPWSPTKPYLNEMFKVIDLSFFCRGIHCPSVNKADKKRNIMMWTRDLLMGPTGYHQNGCATSWASVHRTENLQHLRKASIFQDVSNRSQRQSWFSWKMF